jgi:hypothetical protein
MKNARPPEIAQRLLQLLLPDQIRDDISGDLYELYNGVIVPSWGIFRARFWYWRQVLCLMPLFFRFRRHPKPALELWKGRIHMDKSMRDALALHPGISMHHIGVGGGIAGLIFVLGTVYLFGIGIPAIRGLLAITAILGIVGARFLYRWRKRHAPKIDSLDLHVPGTEHDQ